MSKEPKNGEKQSVLIVEDSIDFSNLLKFIIEDMGFVGIQAPVDVEDIVTLAQDHNPVTILMDLALRRRGGMQFIEELKAEPSTQNIPIIILTGRELNSKEVLQLQLRGVKYLRKGRVEMEDIKKEILSSAGVKAAPEAVKKAKKA
jgi:twitching motility two-component system response regulator PilH